MNLCNAELIINFITFSIAYVVVVTLLGALQAWAIYKLGDDTAKNEGLMTLSPIAHVDPIGALLFMTISVGWGRRIPIDPHNIQGRFRYTRIVLSYLVGPVAYFIMSMFSLLGMIMLSDVSVINSTSVMMIYPQCQSHMIFAQEYPHLSSVSLSLVFILFGMAYLSILFCVLDLIFHACHMVMALVMEEYEDAQRYLHWIYIVPIIVMIFFSSHFYIFITRCMISSGYWIASFLRLF